MFMSIHLAGNDLAIKFRDGETYKKVFGPVFVYLNSKSGNANTLTLWKDAEQQVIQSYYQIFPLVKLICPKKLNN